MKYFSLLSVIIILVSSCEINQKDVQPTDEFIKIYNHPDENLAYFVESVIKLSEGYLILSSLKDHSQGQVEFPTSSLIRTDDLGEVLWATQNDFRAPVGNLVEYDGNVVYAAQDNSDNAVLVNVNIESGGVTTTTLQEKWPLKTGLNSDGKLILLSYDYNAISSVVSVYSAGNRSQTASFSIDLEMEIPIERHLNKVGNKMPFFIGNWQSNIGNGFFVNCISNSVLGVRFFDNGGSSIGGWIFSSNNNDAISSLLHKQDNQYGLTRYFENINYITPTVNVDINGNQSFNDSTQNPIPGLVSNANVSALKANFGANEYMFFAGTSNSNSIKVFQYRIDENELLYEHEIEFADNVEVIQIIQDPDDEGLVILGQLHVTGRFLRPVLLKVPAKDFKE